MIAVPTRVSVFWTSVVKPSVTSWSIASTSFVRRLMITPARLRSKKPSESRCRWRKSRLRRSARIRSPDPAGRSRSARSAARELDEPGAEEDDDDPRQSRVRIVARGRLVDRELGEERRRERDRRRGEQRDERERRARLVRAREPAERRAAAAASAATTSRRPRAPRSTVRWRAGLPDPHRAAASTARRTAARAGRARRSRGRHRSSRSARRACRAPRSARGRGRRSRRRARSSRAGAR